MTTVLGIRAANDTGIVLASDTQWNIYEEGKFVAKKIHKKIIYGNNWALVNSGEDGKELRDFYGFMLGYKTYKSSEELVAKTIQETIKNRRFMKIDYLNMLLRKKDVDLEDLNTFILAISSPEMGLWYVNEYGSLKPAEPTGDIDFDFVCVGEEDKVQSRIEELLLDESKDYSELTIPKASELAYEGLIHSMQAANTGGPPDIVILTPGGIEPFGKAFREKRAEGDRSVLKMIEGRYSSSEEGEKK